MNRADSANEECICTILLLNFVELEVGFAAK